MGSFLLIFLSSFALVSQRLRSPSLLLIESNLPTKKARGAAEGILPSKDE